MPFSNYEDELESFAKRKDRRKPKGRRSVNALHVDKAAAVSSASKFADPGLQELYEQGHLSELKQQLQSGKEATVYLAEGPRGLLAAKLYAERKVRSFKVDEIYNQGRYITRARRKKASQQSALTGMSRSEMLWIEQEYLHLRELYEAGLPVPKPVAQEGAVVLMEFVGDESGPAPRLAEVDLSLKEAQTAFRTSLDHLIAMLKLGKIHGDYSSFNLLWWQDNVVIIDVPQMVSVKENRQAKLLLERDVTSLCKSFEAFGLELEPQKVLAEIAERVLNH